MAIGSLRQRSSGFQGPPLRSYMAKVKDKASIPFEHLLIFLENCREGHIKNFERLNSLKLYSIGNHVDDRS